MFASSQHHQLFRRRARAGFSLTELLVVIGIIVLLVGLLLVALGQVQRKAKRTKTESTMRQFVTACEAFQAAHGFYPGVIPEEFLQFASESFTSTENALLHLMGGYRVLSPHDANGSPVFVDYQAFKTQAAGNSPSSMREFVFTNPATTQTYSLVVDLRRIGEGPTINSKPYQPYFTPSQDQLVVVEGQAAATNDPELPDLVDAWGQPMLYLKQARNRGLLVDAAASGRPQFLLGGLQPYLSSTGLGEYSQSQSTSLFNIGGVPMFAVMLSHEAFYKAATPAAGTARGAVVMVSAGPDGIFFANNDGPGQSTPITAGGVFTNLILTPGPKILAEFDDVVTYGGG